MKVRLERVVLVAGMTLAALNVWTGAPLLGLWVGSRMTGGQRISMLAVFGTVVAMGAACWAMLRVLAVLSARHDRLTGRQATVRRHTPWLRSMSGARTHAEHQEGPQLTALEYLMVSMVVVVIVLFEAWFFFFSGSPFDSSTGRD